MKIVIVEDEPIATRILLIMLEKYPFVELILSSETVADSIKLINEVNPDVVFLDLGLGDEDGFDVLRSIKKTKPWVQFCITTNDTRVVTSDKASKLGADLFVRKPFSPDRIEEAIYAMGGHKSTF